MFKYIYGPVSSWRLGISLGIDLLSGEEKICSFDCSYCQVGKTGVFSLKRKIYVPTVEVTREIEQLPADIAIDYYTFSGRGEPTLAANLGEVAAWIHMNRNGKCALLTNGALIGDPKLEKELMEIDLISLKMDAFSEGIFKKVNRPAEGILITEIRKHMSEFRKRYSGTFGIQIMVLRENIPDMADIAEFCRKLKPDIVHLNTPLRDSPVLPVTPEELEKVELLFAGLPVVSVYRATRKKVQPLTPEETLKKRGRESDE